ncbi:hypothetical protein ACFPRL_09265 [Pseudoclavibacter helvolus]
MRRSETNRRFRRSTNCVGSGMGRLSALEEEVEVVGQPLTAPASANEPPPRRDTSTYSARTGSE